MRIPCNFYDAKRGIWQPKETEEMILQEIMTRLCLAKIPVYRIAERIPVKGKRWQRLSTPGLPDLWGWIMRRHLTIGGFQTEEVPVPLMIEVKRPGGARRIAQIRFIEEAKSAGCVAFFAESFSDVVSELEKFGINLSK